VTNSNGFGREELLRQVPLFRDLSRDQLRTLVDQTRPHTAAKGVVIIAEGDQEPGFLVFLISGRANVIISDTGGREIILAVIEAPGVVGEIGVLDGLRRSATLRADIATDYLRISAKRFLECIRSDAAFAETVAKHVASTLRRTNEHLRVISTFEAKDRVVWCLSVLARQYGKRHSGDLVLEHHLMHRDIGDMTSLSRETATRQLRELESEGCITQQRDRLIVHVQPINDYLDRWPWLADPRL
jgi:CRP-like cAMP-binding protein